MYGQIVKHFVTNACKVILPKSNYVSDDKLQLEKYGRDFETLVILQYLCKTGGKLEYLLSYKPQLY